MKTTSSRTKKFFEEQGYVVVPVEKWNPFIGPTREKEAVQCPECRCLIPQYGPAGGRQDLLGFADLMIFHPVNPGVMLIQCTSGGEHARRRDKILASERAQDWINQPTREIAIVSWSKKKKKLEKGWSKQAFWTPRIEFITEEELGKEPF
jgi:hypothetical protein